MFTESLSSSSTTSQPVFELPNNNNGRYNDNGNNNINNANVHLGNAVIT